ncbi:MAG: GDSL-type esterase/lipase family protein [Pseudomonadota bacterium]
MLTRLSSIVPSLTVNSPKPLLLVGLATLGIVLQPTESQAAQIVVLGDSWATRIGPSLVVVAGEQDVSVATAGIGGDTAAALANHPNHIESVLAANPDAKVIHLSIGGNDLLDFGEPISSRSADQEAALLDSVRNNVQRIVDRIAAVQPSADVYHVSYDFLRPLPSQGTPEQVNNAFLRQASVLESEIISDRYTYLNNYGVAQEAFGISLLGLPPGDPTLPRLDQPGPAEAFDDAIHFNQEAYFAYADLVFNQYGQSLSVPEPSTLAVLSLGVLVLSSRHRY